MAEHSKDLIARTFEFAKAVRLFINKLPKSVSNYEDSKQLVRASGSIAANYLEAQEGLSRKDFFYRIRICLKEARESGLWLRLLDAGSDACLMGQREKLLQESSELTRIFSAIAGKDDTGG